MQLKAGKRREGKLELICTLSHSGARREMNPKSLADINLSFVVEVANTIFFLGEEKGDQEGLQGVVLEPDGSGTEDVPGPVRAIAARVRGL